MFSDRPATLVYLDPPYFVKREHGYVIDSSDQSFHSELLGVCVHSQCMILHSGYDNPFYETTLVKNAGWIKEQMETHTHDTTGKDYARTEVLWMNRQFKEARRSGRVPIRLSKAEIAENKVNPPRKR
jgi:DNA adenine methylase